MNGDLAQAICLIGNATDWLRRADGAPPELEDRSLFEYVEWMRFVLERPDGEPLVAPDTRSWMEQLADRGAQRLWLVTGVVSHPYEDRYMSAFAGGGNWAIVASTNGEQELWRGRSAVGDPDAPDKKVWRVAYFGAPNSDQEVDRPGLDATRAELLAALEDAREYAAGQNLDLWANLFAAALQVGHADGDPDSGTQPDWLPRTSYGAGARHLLATAEKAWVFGGMGSWNDIAEDDEGRYDAVSERLYAAVLRACVAAVNAPLSER